MSPSIAYLQRWVWRGIRSLPIHLSRTRPSIAIFSATHWAQEHEVDFYLCPSLEFNPNTARIPGAPGLLMYGTPREDNRRRGAIQPIFTNISTTESQLLYMGEYELLTSRLLARQEWLEQPYEVRRTWSDGIMTNHWGLKIRTSIALRRDQRSNPHR